MNPVLSTMRKERLRYAITREIDRQASTITDEAKDMLVEHAAKNIDAYFSDGDKRGVAAELAEKSVNPVLHALAEVSDGEITPDICQLFLNDPSVAEFPWTKGMP